MHAQTQMKSIYCVFAFIGISSVHRYLRNNSRVRNTLIHVPTLIQGAVVFMEAYIVLKYPDEIYHRSTRLGAFTDLVQVGGTLAVGFIQILENILKAPLDENIYKNINKIDLEISARHYCRGSGCTFYRDRSLNSFLISRTFFLIGLGLTLDLFIIFTIPDVEKLWRQSIMVREVTANMIRIGLLQISCHFFWVSIQNLKTI